jgi:hypothetical protein
VIALITAVLANRREAMPDSSLRRHTINVDHVQISCARPFAKVWAALQKDAPALDPQLAQDLTAAHAGAIAERRIKRLPFTVPSNDC